MTLTFTYDTDLTLSNFVVFYELDFPGDLDTISGVDLDLDLGLRNTMIA